MFNNKEELKQWVENYILVKGKKSLHVAINNSKNIKRLILEYTNFLPDNTKLNQRCFHIISNLYEIPLCKECKLNIVNFNNRNKDWRYLQFCSVKCGRVNKESQDKYKTTNIFKYGVDNYSKTDKFKEQMMKINMEEYGVDWYQQSDDFKEKSIITCLKKYGVDRYTKTNEFIEKVRNSCLERYGVDWYSKSEEFNEKYKEASMLKYGVSHPMLNDGFKNKISNTIKNKYGENWYVLTNEFKDIAFLNKELKYGNPIIGGYKLKEYKLPSGNIIKIQGYEDFALDMIFLKYKEEDISISYYDIKAEIGILNYLIEEKKRMYIPDIYIKPENKIIEVKSEYTYNLELEKNLLKKEACIQIGLNFEFWVFDKKGKLLQKI